MRATPIAAGILLACLVVQAPPAYAQMSPDDVAQTGPRSEEVESAIAWERVDSEVLYLRPTADFKPGEDVRINIPEPPRDGEEAREQQRLSTGLIFGAILLAVLFLFFKFGNRIQVSFGSGRDRRRGSGEDADDGLPDIAIAGSHGLLDRIAAMADRREALILLTGHALERAARMNGVTLARAQTARDVLRVLPGSWTHMPAMRELVRETEIVHFGGRALAEDTWRACLAAARPLFAGRRVG